MFLQKKKKKKYISYVLLTVPPYLFPNIYSHQKKFFIKWYYYSIFLLYYWNRYHIMNTWDLKSPSIFRVLQQPKLSNLVMCDFYTHHLYSIFLSFKKTSNRILLFRRLWIMCFRNIYSDWFSKKKYIYIYIYSDCLKI